MLANQRQSIPLIADKLGGDNGSVIISGECSKLDNLLISDDG